MLQLTPILYRNMKYTKGLHVRTPEDVRLLNFNYGQVLILDDQRKTFKLKSFLVQLMLILPAPLCLHILCKMVGKAS
jgi:hypothetical protein